MFLLSQTLIFLEKISQKDNGNVPKLHRGRGSNIIGQVSQNFRKSLTPSQIQKDLKNLQSGGLSVCFVVCKQLIPLFHLKKYLI